MSPKNAWNQTHLLWLSMGYGILIVNYIGSMGFGLQSLNKLSGNIGDADVENIYEMLKYSIQNFEDEVDADHLGIMGGSHGGFLTSSFVSHDEYKNVFKAASIHNPVIALHQMAGISDIPCWIDSTCFNKDYDSYYVSKETVIATYDRSPCRNVNNVTTPCMFVIGDDDNRVDASQGIQFHRVLKSNGVKTELFFYPGNTHEMDGIEASNDVELNMARWWIKYLE